MHALIFLLLFFSLFFFFLGNCLQLLLEITELGRAKCCWLCAITSQFSEMRQTSFSRQPSKQNHCHIISETIKPWICEIMSVKTE